MFRAKNLAVLMAAGIMSAGTLARASTVLGGPVTDPANGHLYYLLSPDTWENSELEATSLGGHLASINDADENTWINTGIANGLNAWIGYNDAASEGNFVWSSGDSSAYTNWFTAEPDNLSGLNGQPQNYVILRFDGTWDDINDGDALNPDYSGVYAVAEVLPEPASLSLMGMAGAALMARRRRD